MIGAISNLDAPLTPSMEGQRALTAVIGGISDELLQKERDEVLNATQADIRALAEPVEAALSDAVLTVVGSEEAIDENSQLFDRTENLFG